MGSKSGPKHNMTTNTENNVISLAIAWAELTKANKALMRVSRGRNALTEIPARKSFAMSKYRAFWAMPGADEYAASQTK